MAPLFLLYTIIYLYIPHSVPCHFNFTPYLTISLFYRPIAGHVNICPGALSTHAHDQEVLLSTVKHEILHALGFSAGLYAFFRDAQGRPRSKRCPTWIRNHSDASGTKNTFRNHTNWPFLQNFKPSECSGIFSTTVPCPSIGNAATTIRIRLR